MTFLTEIRALAATLAAPAARLLEVDDHAVAHVRRVHVAADLRDPADDLVPGDERLTVGCGHRVEEMEVRVAHAGGKDLHEDLLGPRLRIRDVDELDLAATFEADRAHRPEEASRWDKRFHLKAGRNLLVR